MRSLEQVNIRTNVRTYVRTYVLTYIRTGQTLYPLHNFVVRGDNESLKQLKRILTDLHFNVGVNKIILKNLSSERGDG